MKILIAILSCYSQEEQNEICRSTWLKDCDVDYKFFVGRGNPTNSDEQSLDTNDDYKSLPFKTLALCQWALDKYDYIFKCDNDTYINTPRLVASGFEEHNYTGYDWEGRGGYCSGGSGYWLSKTSMEIVSTSYFIEDIMDPVRGSLKGEDLQVGEALRSKGIFPVGDLRYRLHEPGPKRHNNVITLHDVNNPCKGNRMIEVHNNF